MTARTHVGISPPSRPLTARTSGSPPVAPPTRHVASGNSTGVWAWLGRWVDGGCPITHFTLELRRPRDPTWTTRESLGCCKGNRSCLVSLSCDEVGGGLASLILASLGPFGPLARAARATLLFVMPTDFMFNREYERKSKVI